MKANDVYASLKNTITVNIEKAVELKNVSQSGIYVITDKTMTYVMVQVGKGLNGSNVSLDLLQPFTFHQKSKAEEYATTVYAENGKGQIEWEVMVAKEFFEKVEMQYRSMWQILENNMQK